MTPLKNPNYDQFSPKFDIVSKTIQRISVPNLKLFGQMKTEVRAKEVWRIFLLCYMGKWAG